MQLDFSEVETSIVFFDEHGRRMAFPSRPNYLDFLEHKRLISKESDFIDRPDLVEQVYLDWLRRGQVGCIFAQLFGRPRNRVGLRTAMLCDSPGSQQEFRDLAQQINDLVHEAVIDPNIEATSILLPTILTAEDLVELLLALSSLPEWQIEFERPWRTLINVGLRVLINSKVWAEVLGLSPMPLLPPTRQSPITSLEIRTKERGSIWSKINPKTRAAHLAQLPTGHFLTSRQHQVRFRPLTPRLRLRVLGGSDDQRAKAGVTFAVPAAIWNALK